MAKYFKKFFTNGYNRIFNYLFPANNEQVSRYPGGFPKLMTK